VKQQREDWKHNQSDLPGERTFFLDEAGAATNMTRRYARSLIGERAVCKIPAGHWKTVTMIGLIGAAGPVAAVTIDGPVDGQAFKTYVQEFMVPNLRRGDVVVMDNLSSHKVSGVREMIEQVGARLMFLPPYSPDLNPIEPIWSKVKQTLRSIQARTQDALMEAVRTAFERVTADDCRHCISHCGYTLQNSG
jgi:transposase